MNPSQVLATLKVGDKFVTQRNHEVVEVGNGFIRTKDANNDGIRFGVPIKADHGSLSVTDVQYAKRKPKVGDELTAGEVFNTKWKRGTVLTDGEGFVYLLSARGYWVSPNTDSDTDTHFEFFDLDPYSAFTVVHLP